MKWYLIIISILLNLKVFAQNGLTLPSYHFSSIEYLIEQEIGRKVLPVIYQNLNIQIFIEPVPAQRAQFLANAGISDGEIMRIYTYGNDNPNTIRVPTPYYHLETMPFVLKDSGIVISSKVDLKKYKVAIVRGVKHTANITEHLTQVYEATSTENMFKLLEQKVVDVVLTNAMDGNYILKRNGYINVEPMDKALIKLPLYHYLHNKHATLVDIVDQEIIRLKNNDDLAKLVKSAEKSITQISSRE